MKTKLSFLVVLALLLGLVVSVSAQTVAAADVIISPETLPGGTYGYYLNQRLTATCDGGDCGYIQWRLTADSKPPKGVTLFNNVFLYGVPEEIGSFTFIVEAYDSAGTLLASHTYDWNVQKATPAVTFVQIMTDPYDPRKTYFTVNVSHDINVGNWPYQPSGSVDITVDGNALEGCTNLQPWGQSYDCVTDDLAGLAPGDHTLKAAFTPDSAHDTYYNSAFATSSYPVAPRAEVLLFDDLDRDGVRDQGEGPTAGMVDLDRGCDGSYETDAYNYGEKLSIPVAPGLYCLNVPRFVNWRPSPATSLPIRFEITATANQYFEIGLYNTVITFSPPALPDAKVGVYYEQKITIQGGKAPYTISSIDQSLPNGMSFDQSSLTLSGTPTALGRGYLSLGVRDADGMTGGWSSDLYAKVAGTFTLTSSPNPSSPGQAVTFTFTGSGDVVDPEYPDYHILPSGPVAFYDGDTAIAGCEGLWLNYDMDSGQMDNPAVCSTSALAIGSHVIRVDFTDYYDLYSDASRTLTQVVGQSDTTPPVIAAHTDVSAEATSAAGAAVTYTPPATSDAVDGAGVASCAPASGSTFALGDTTVTCNAADKAGNAATPTTFVVKVADTAAPSLTLPVNIITNATGNSVATVTYQASANDLVDGSVTVYCSPVSGSTFTVGTTAVNCSATDAHSNTATRSFTVTVNYTWAGFLQPVDNLPTLNRVKAGSSVPVKFSLGGNQGLGIFQSGPSVRVIACPAGLPVDNIESLVTASSSNLSYDATTNQYVYVWKTDKAWAGTCRQLTFTLKDGTVYSANFQFTK